MPNTVVWFRGVEIVETKIASEVPAIEFIMALQVFDRRVKAEGITAVRLIDDSGNVIHECPELDPRLRRLRDA